MWCLHLMYPNGEEKPEIFLCFFNYFQARVLGPNYVYHLLQEHLQLVCGLVVEHQIHEQCYVDWGNIYT